MPAPNLNQKELAALRTKKIHEKVIGGKFNLNDEVNQIAQQTALYNMGINMLGPAGGNTGKKVAQVRK